MSNMTRELGSRAPNKYDLFAGEKLREIRLAHQLTLSELSSRLGLSHQQLQKYETGVNRISVGMLAEMCDVLNVSPITFFSSEEYGNSDMQLANIHMSVNKTCRSIDHAITDLSNIQTNLRNIDKK